ncbi:MAG TPA: phosphoadenosine phosphosulfate reductase family protein [Allocoleopsis sp.]
MVDMPPIEELVTSRKAIDAAIASIQTYAKDYQHWAISWSGGKDSTCLVILVHYLIEQGLIPKPDTLTVLYADTRQELIPLQESAKQITVELKKRGIDVRVVLPELDKRFLVYMLGRGVCPPNNSTLRWCTRQIKLEPMQKELLLLKEQIGEKFLVLTGVRIGESEARDNRINLSCSRNKAECGQGYFQRDLPDALCDRLAPLAGAWRTCTVWDFLMVDAPRMGFNTEILAEAYGGDDRDEHSARTGCVGCPIVEKDKALEAVLALPQWAYLAPLRRLKELYKWGKLHENRLQKVKEFRKSIQQWISGRKGPLTLEARRHMLAEVLAIQKEINQSARQLGRPEVDLLNEEERRRIEELIAAGTFPNGWKGDEPTGEQFIHSVLPDGNTQLCLFAD